MLEILILFLLIMLNGLFALSEIAIISSKRARLEHHKQKGSKGAATVLKLLESSEYFLSSIQVGITLIGIVTGMYGGMKIADDVAPFFEYFNTTRPLAMEISLTLTVFLITYVSIVLGELVPKTIALSNPEKIAIRFAPVVQWFAAMFYPFVKLLSFSTRIVNRILGIKKYHEPFSQAELLQMIKVASHEGTIEKAQNQMHEKVFYFADKRAKHIMTHRTEVDWVNSRKAPEEIQQMILESKHSKILVGEDSPDNFTGILAVKEYLLKTRNGNYSDINDLVTDPLIIPENTSAQKVLDLFRHKHIYFAVVVNEYGSFQGIITLHDIMENLVGAIPEEGEYPEPDLFVREDKSALVSGDAPIETLQQVIEDFIIDFETMDYSTVAGFVLANINKIPQIGDKFDFHNHEIEIIDIDGNKIDKILVKKKNTK